MTDRPNKRVTESGQPLPEAPDFGKARRRKAAPPPLPGAICRTVSRLAEEFRAAHGVQDHRTAERIGRLLKSSITSRKPRGRRVSTEVRDAAEMRSDGATWPSIFQALVPGYGEMDKYERTYSTQRLRDNVTAYLKRRKRRRPKPEHSIDEDG